MFAETANQNRGRKKLSILLSFFFLKAEAMGERQDNANIGQIGDHLVLYSDPSTRN
jgi:hypothetical protein